MEKMDDFEDFDIRVDKFLRHQMTAEEEKAFKSEIASDEEKKERARVTALMVKTMQQEGGRYDQNIINDIRNISEMQYRKTLGLKPRVLNLWLRIIKYSVAACVAGIILVGGYRYHEYKQTVLLGKSQYMAYVSDISEKSSVRGVTEEQNYQKMEELFANVKEGKELETTIRELESLYEKSLVSVLYLQTDSCIATSISADFLDDISWNLAIAYLKNGEREKPIPILEGMLRRNANYPEISRPVQELIDKINSL